MELAADAIARGNANAASDGLSAAHVLHAAVHAGLANVAINVAGLKDETVASALRAEADDVRSRADALVPMAQAAFVARIA
jgi:formiminotetrahydrofolate cyclodeaminase